MKEKVCVVKGEKKIEAWVLLMVAGGQPDQCKAADHRPHLVCNLFPPLGFHCNPGEWTASLRRQGERDSPETLCARITFLPRYLGPACPQIRMDSTFLEQPK